MRKRINRFLIISISAILLLCVGVFVFLSIFISKTNDQAVNNIGSVYMEGVSQQISKHFRTAMNLQLEQVEDIAVVAQDLSYDQMKENLVKDAQDKKFSFLGLYNSNGDINIIYTEYNAELKLEAPAPFLSSLKNGDKKITVASTVESDSSKIIMLGVPAKLSMEDNSSSLALIAGIRPDYVNGLLGLDANNMMDSYIILKNGDYVIRNLQENGGNYFVRVKELFETYEGKKADRYIEELQDYMNNPKDCYSTICVIANERRHLHCTSLPYSEWYLITVMPFDNFDSIVDNMTMIWTISIFSSCAFIILLILSIAITYYVLSKKQMRELEIAQVEAIRANKSKSEFLSNMSHDIRTPMNAIVGMAAIATANITNPQQVQNCLKKITLSSKHLLGLINDVLDMSKIESGKMILNVDQVSLREVMESIVSIVQPQVKAKKQVFDVFIKNIEFENVYCDSVRLNQILLNFLSNAIKFTPDGGSIQLSLYQEGSPLGNPYIRVHIHVKDSGIGMTPEFKDKIFDSFTREDSARVRKTEGTGLGMAITKYIVDAMGGTIEVESELGKGSEFHVILDLERSEITEAEMVLPNWKMLVVDDDEMLCTSTVASLEEIGIHADWTLTGENAIKIIKEKHKKKEDYEIILLDWKLPGIDGIETARQIRKELGNNIPILLVSAYDWGEIEQEAREACIDGFISKPLFKSTLYYGLKQFAGDQEVEESKNEDTTTSSLSGRRVLLAEDNELNCEVAADLLTPLGLILDFAENGKVCVDKFTDSSLGFYDAILMDLRMPIMSGYDATRAIRAMMREDANIPIIAMTADAFTEDAKKCLEAGMNAHISKPIEVKTVVKILEKFIKD